MRGWRIDVLESSARYPLRHLQCSWTLLRGWVKIGGSSSTRTLNLEN